MSASDDTQLQPTAPIRLTAGGIESPSARVYDDALPPPWLREGRYVYLSTLGVGGMGRVYLVQDKHLLRKVALKVMRPELGASIPDSALFMEEAQAVSQLEHPHIIPLYDMGRSSTDDLYYTMQYVKNDSLAGLLQRLKKGDPDAMARWPFQKRARLLVELCDALAFAHDRGVLHRDIKPANILLSERDEVMLTDWGISLRQEASSFDSSLHQGSSRGTPGYISPEGVSHGEHTVRSEIFSLGVVMYQLLALEHPFKGQTGDQITTAVLSQAVPAPDTRLLKAQGRVPRELSLICMRCIEKDPERRYPSMAEVATALEAYLHGVAPVVCVQTGLKRSVYRFARFADDHGSAVIIGLCVLIVLPVVSLVCWWLVTR